jgi:hypothetical protein
MTTISALVAVSRSERTSALAPSAKSALVTKVT